jgi:hypothetical protein
MNLDVFKAGKGLDPSQGDAKSQEIETSKAAKLHFFSQDYVQKYK